MRAIAVREDISDLILDAADRLLARYGYKKMTMDDVAKEVGIGKGTIYLHFKSKEEIVLATVDRIVARVLQQLQIISQSRSSPTEKMRRMLVLGDNRIKWAVVVIGRALEPYRYVCIACDPIQ